MGGKIKHGKSRTREYKSYHSMMARCYHPEHRSYKYYGGRANNPIKVCERWHNIDNFLSDARMLPGYTDGLKGLTLDRIDTNSDYSPENCMWSDALTQQNNKRNNVVLQWKGQWLTLAELGRVEDIPYRKLSNCYNWNKDKIPLDQIVERAKKRKTDNLAEIARQNNVDYAKLYHQCVTRGKSIKEALDCIKM